MPQKDDRGGQMQESLEVFSVILTANYEAAKVKEPGEESLVFSAAFVAAQWATVLGGHFAIDIVGRNQFRVVFLHQLRVHPTAVVSIVADIL